MIDSDIIEDNTENNFKESDKSRLRMILLLFVLFIGFWGLSFISDKWLDNRIIKRIAIYGNNMAQKEDILPLISDSIINKQIKNINSSEIIKIVKTNDFVFDVYADSEKQQYVSLYNYSETHIDNIDKTYFSCDVSCITSDSNPHDGDTLYVNKKNTDL